MVVAWKEGCDVSFKHTLLSANFVGTASAPTLSNLRQLYVAGFVPVGVASLAVNDDANTLFIAYENQIAKAVLTDGTWSASVIAGDAVAGSSGFADGDGLNARFGCRPTMGAAIDRSENRVDRCGITLDNGETTLYVADYFNNRIRAVNLSSASYAVTTVAGYGVPGMVDGAALDDAAFR